MEDIFICTKVSSVYIIALVEDDIMVVSRVCPVTQMVPVTEDRAKEYEYNWVTDHPNCYHFISVSSLG